MNTLLALLCGEVDACLDAAEEAFGRYRLQLDEPYLRHFTYPYLTYLGITLSVTVLAGLKRPRGKLSSSPIPRSAVMDVPARPGPCGAVDETSRIDIPPRLPGGSINPYLIGQGNSGRGAVPDGPSQLHGHDEPAPIGVAERCSRGSLARIRL